MNSFTHIGKHIDPSCDFYAAGPIFVVINENAVSIYRRTYDGQFVLISSSEIPECLMPKVHEYVIDINSPQGQRQLKINYS